MKPQRDSFTVILRSGVLSAHVHCFPVPWQHNPGSRESTLGASLSKWRSVFSRGAAKIPRLARTLGRTHQLHLRRRLGRGRRLCAWARQSGSAAVAAGSRAGSSARLLPEPSAPPPPSRQGRVHGSPGAFLRGGGDTARPVTQPCSPPLRAALEKCWVSAWPRLVPEALLSLLLTPQQNMYSVWSRAINKVRNNNWKALVCKITKAQCFQLGLQTCTSPCPTLLWRRMHLCELEGFHVALSPSVHSETVFVTTLQSILSKDHPASK